MTGGAGVATNKAEVILGDGTTCMMPNLPDLQKGYAHSQSGLTICGGTQNKKGCSTLKNGVWQISHTLRSPRMNHINWKTSHGLMLLGGTEQLRTTELLSSTSSSHLHLLSSTNKFTLPYDTQ